MQTKLKPLHALIYGLPGLPLAMLGLPLYVYLPTFYSEGLGLSFMAVGFALLAARVLDLVTDPLIGWYNDKLEMAKWRRKLFIIAGVPLLLIGLHYLLKPDAAHVSIWYLFAWSFVSYLGWTLINIPWLAWGAEISDDYHAKSTLASSREVFAVIGTLIVISLPVILSIQEDLRQTLAVLADLLLWLIPVTLLLLISLVPDETSLPLQDGKGASGKFTLKNSLTVISHPAVKRLLPSYFVNSFANALPATLFILFVTHVLQTPDKVGILLISYFLSAIIGLPLWLYLARKTDKHRSWMFALVVSVASFIWVPFLGSGDFIPFLVICVLSGFALGADVVLPASIQADIAQDINGTNQINNGSEPAKPRQDASGLLFGFWGLLTKLALALAVGIAFPVLDGLGLQNDIPSSGSVIALALLYSLLPVILKIWVMFRMWNFPFDQTYFAHLQHHSSEGDTNEDKKRTVKPYATAKRRTHQWVQ